MAWFRKEKKPREAIEKQVSIPEGLWIKCDDCKEIIYRKEVEQNLNVCTKCGFHFRLTARERFEMLFDDSAYKEFATNIRSTDPLFRPVNFNNAPDGTLYLTDLYRGIIQEGNWVKDGSYLRKAVQQYAPKYGIAVAGEESIDTKASNYRSLAQKIKSSGADGLFFGGLTVDGGPQLRNDISAVIRASSRLLNLLYPVSRAELQHACA